MQIIHLNANSFSMFPRVAMVQNDTGRELKMVLDDMTLSGSETGAVAIHRSDGSYYTIPATRVVGDNAFTADMSQALTQPRQTECQLKITASDDTVISTYTFVIEVQPSTDGLSEEQLGINPQDLIDAAAQLTLGDNDVKLALLQIAEKTAYVDQNGQTYYDALENSLYPPIRATSVSLDQNSLVFSELNATQTLMATISPNNVEDDTVYWGSSDTGVAVVSDGIVTSVGEGTATITATCGTVHKSASVLVALAYVASITASYTQNEPIPNIGTIDEVETAGTLVVTASWSDGTSTTVPSTDYTVSGTLTVGTAPITVSYAECTTTFNITVSQAYKVYSDPLSFNSTYSAKASWNTSTLTGKLTAAGTSDWPGLAMKGLQYKYSDVSSMHYRFSVTVEMTGYSSGNGVDISLGVYTTNNPANNSTNKKAGKALTAVKANGTTVRKSEGLVSSLFSATGLDNYYLGLGFMINAPIGPVADLSDVQFYVY